ncbi:MAG: glycoside hydrolase family 16 protein [Prevotella sp.]|nr:glycoside hydrolase family 16 protein [Prevotella sp.]
MRISNILFGALLAVVIPTTASAQAIEGAPEGYQLVWEDNFDGTALNEKAWSIEVSGSGGGNQELQYYRRENVSVADGNLILTAKRENYQGKSFTSGRINSNQKAAFKHGIMQAKIKFPMTANGLWPAYWMMGNDINRYGWPRCGEIDIVEMGHFNAITGAYAGWQDRYFSGTLHYGPDATNEHHQQNSQEFSKDKFESIGAVEGDYHIFTIEWDENYLYMYYDLEGYNNARKNRARYYTLGITESDDAMAPGHYFQKPFYFLFNLAVGGTFPNIYDPAKVTALPNDGDEAKMYVDWVRVYQKEDDKDAQYLYYDADGEKVTNIPDEPEPEHHEDIATELSGFASLALDENGETTFDFSDVSDAVLISTSEGVTGHLYAAGATVYDYNVNNDNRNLYIWDNTYVPVSRDGKTNSFGWDEGYNMFTVASAGWSGLGFNIKDEDLSMIDDTYWLHFALKADDVERRTSHQITVSNANFIVGRSDGKLASVGDFKRDGQWYYFDIPVKALRQFATPLFKGNPAAFDDNIIAFISGGVTDSEVSFDNIFFYKSKTKEIPTYKDTTSDLGKFGYKSVNEDGTWAFDLEQVGTIVPIQLSEDVWKGVTGDGAYSEENLLKAEQDYTQSNNYYTWEGTIAGDHVDDVANSSGVFTGGISAWAATANLNWNGMGIASASEKDLSMIDDSYYLHIALRSDAAVGHIPVRVRFGAEDNDAILTFGAYSTHPIFADFPRDGEWYAFDIPVAELRKYGKLWSKNGNGKVNVGDNLLCFYTMDTYYTGSWFSFDNIFFWKKKDGSTPEVSELGDFTTKSLDEDGESYLTLENKEFINFNVSEATISMQTEGGTVDENILAGYYTLNNWEGDTYSSGDKSGNTVNSFGIEGQGWIDWVVGTKGWSGGGFLEGDGADLTILEDGDWYLHFAMRGTDNCNHLIGFAESRFTIGSEPYDENTPVIGNYKRDNEWYSFDIPYSFIKKSFPSLYPQNNGGQSAWKGNLVWFMSGGNTGDELQIDNLFFWREKKAEEPEPDPETDGLHIVRGNEIPAVAVPYANAVFDLQGHRVATLSDVQSHRIQLRKGIYVINGKKIVIR